MSTCVLVTLLSEVWEVVKAAKYIKKKSTAILGLKHLLLVHSLRNSCSCIQTPVQKMSIIFNAYKMENKGSPIGKK